MCIPPRAQHTTHTRARAEALCANTPPHCCAHGSCCPSHARALTPACKQQPAVHTPVLTPQHLHIHTHTCDSSARTDTCTDPTAPPQPFESPSKLPLLLNSSSPGSTNQYSSPPPPPFSACSWALSNTSASKCTSALHRGGDRDPISQGGGWGALSPPSWEHCSRARAALTAHPLGDGTDRGVLKSSFRVESSSPSPIPTHRGSRTRHYFGAVRKHLTFRRAHRRGHRVQTMALCSPPATSCSPQPGCSSAMVHPTSWGWGCPGVCGGSVTWNGSGLHMVAPSSPPSLAAVRRFIQLMEMVIGNAEVGWSRVIAASLQPARRRRKRRRWWPCEGCACTALPTPWLQQVHAFLLGS